MKHFNWLPGGLVVLLLSVTLLSGCVSSSVHETLRSQYATLAQENANLKAQYNQLKAQYDKLKGDYDRAYNDRYEEGYDEGYADASAYGGQTYDAGYAEGRDDGLKECLDGIRETAQKCWHSQQTPYEISYYTVDEGRIVVVTIAFFRWISDLAGFAPQ